MSKAASAGDWSILLRISDYGGLPDDPKVRVEIFVTTGAALSGGGDPSWDGSDAWRVDAESLADGTSLDDPSYFDDNAYVSDGVLVANLPNLPLRIAGGAGALHMRLRGALLLGKLREGATAWELRDALIVGRWSLGEVFATVGSYRSDAGEPLCMDAPTYAAITARSYHAGGIVNVALMDGSVRNVSKSISPAVWRALGTRAGGEVVGDY